MSTKTYLQSLMRVEKERVRNVSRYKVKSNGNSFGVMTRPKLKLGIANNHMHDPVCAWSYHAEH